LLEQGIRIINLDETAIVSLGVKGYSWYPKGKVKRVCEKTVTQRISLTAAID
jgi:hypothetical protein